jgi:calcineurin-like phosphoesterase family protein
LYDVFAQRWYRGGSIYLYSDPHFGDAEMNAIRGITDEEQINRINAVVHKNDTLIILGDVGDIERVKKLKAGYKVLILGNHDRGASYYKRKIAEIEHNSDTCPKCGGEVNHDLLTAYNCGYEYAWCPECGTVKPKDDVYEDNHLFDEVYEGALIISNKIVLSHEPVGFLPEFLFNIHGHQHNLSYNSLYMNICAEHINYTPVSLKEIVTSGVLKNTPDIHRIAIDKQIARKNLTGEPK